MKVVVTGATGYVGVPLVKALQQRGDQIVVLTRDAAKAKVKLGDVDAITADIETPGTWAESLAGADAVLHLAGESVGAKRWDAREKQKIRDSRVESTRTIVEIIGLLPAEKRPTVFVHASGTDYYPFAPEKDEFDDDPVTEADKPGDSFLARVCRDWEKEAHVAEKFGLRVASMRSGIVLGPPGGALDKMSTAFKLHVGGKLGSGQQFMPWIHRDDAVAGYITALTDERYSGAFNLVTASTRNKDFSRALAAALGRSSWLAVPGFAVKLGAGEFAEYVLRGRNVIPARMKSLGFTWTRAMLESALADAS
ncbi:MAG TPA: TIGR01777 family oxidoreductase [Kofleriaceae bacterium]|jgi:hypothetical protein